MEKCNEDWETCGHCKAAFGESAIYPSCDKVGVLGAVLGNDICPNAPDWDAPIRDTLNKGKTKKKPKDVQPSDRDELVYVISELCNVWRKYEALHDKLKNYIDDPDDLVEVEALCVKAGSDETLDRLMNIAGCDTLDDFEAFVKRWSKYERAARLQGQRGDLVLREEAREKVPGR